MKSTGSAITTLCKVSNVFVSFVNVSFALGNLWHVPWLFFTLWFGECGIWISWYSPSVWVCHFFSWRILLHTAFLKQHTANINDNQYVCASDKRQLYGNMQPWVISQLSMKIWLCCRAKRRWSQERNIIACPYVCSLQLLSFKQYVFNDRHSKTMTVFISQL